MLKIRELRIEKGLSQEDLAKILFVKNYTIGNWERERSEPNSDEIIKLADYFEVTTDYLLGRENYAGNVQIIGERLTDDEQEILTLYRKLTFQNKNQVKGFTKGLLSYQ